MKLNILSEKYKGGPGSGDFGHRGRPGQIGGSASRTANRQLYLSMFNKFEHDIELYENRFEEITNGKSRDVVRFIHDAYVFEDESSGINTNVTSVSLTKSGKIRISGRVYNAQGDEIGTMVRNLDNNPYDAGIPIITNSVLTITEPSYIGSGFGAKFYKNSEELAMEYGIEAIELNANSEVGGYAWARMGYDFTDRIDRNLIKQSLSLEYANRYAPAGSDKLKVAMDFHDKLGNITAYEIASMIGPDGYRIGKYILLGRSWKGIKYLNPDNLGYQAGQEYYASKGL